MGLLFYRFKTPVGESIAVWNCSGFFVCFYFLFLLLLWGNQTTNTRLTAVSAEQSDIWLPEPHAIPVEFLATGYSELSKFTAISSRWVCATEVPWRLVNRKKLCLVQEAPELWIWELWGEASHLASFFSPWRQGQVNFCSYPVQLLLGSHWGKYIFSSILILFLFHEFCNLIQTCHENMAAYLSNSHQRCFYVNHWTKSCV